VRSLANFKYVLRRSEGTAETDAVFLDLYVLIYDMLNDDDTEIRDLAAEVASWLLSGSTGSLQRNIAYSPLRAAKYLIDLIGDYYSSSADLCHTAIERILGQKIPRGLRSDLIRLQAVQDSIIEYQRDSTVLFETEKQNLFIDETREVDNWMKVLLRLNGNAYEDNILQSLYRWVHEGLEYLLVKASLGEEDGPLGWTSKPEIYVVGMQVISAARLFVSSTSPILYRLLHEKENVAFQLKSLREHGTSISLHPHWLSRIDLALSST
jgi:hypothetical protein